MGNKKVEMTSSLSPQQQGIEKLMGQQISGGMGQGVAPYTGAIASNPDALSLMAAQMMAQYMNPGSVYQLPTQQMGQNYGAQQGQGQPQMPPQMGQQPPMGQMPQGMPQGFNPFQAKRQ